MPYSKHYTHVTTKPLQVGPVTVGEQDADIKPFEPADIDYANLNERQKRDPTYGHAQVPDSIVNSCSECCMESINGQPNLRRLLHRNLVKSCSQCPVSHASDLLPARDSNGNTLFVRQPDGSIRPMTKSEAVKMAHDGTA